MKVKYCVLLLFCLAALQRGDCFDLTKVKLFRNRSEKFYTIFLAHFKNVNQVAWLMCGKIVDTNSSSQFLCQRLENFTNVNPERYIVYVTRLKDGWLLRITAIDSISNYGKGWFACERLSTSKENSADNYFGFVKNLTNASETDWFVCHRAEDPYEGCSGGDYCSI